MLFPEKFKIWLSHTPTDMRKAINGLSCLIIENFDMNPQTGDFFIFYNRKRDRIKILYWHYNGFCLLHKRLEESGFKIPKNLDSPMTIMKNALSIDTLPQDIDSLKCMILDYHQEVERLKEQIKLMQHRRSLEKNTTAHSPKN